MVRAPALAIMEGLSQFKSGESTTSMYEYIYFSSLLFETFSELILMMDFYLITYIFKGNCCRTR